MLGGGGGGESTLLVRATLNDAAKHSCQENHKPRHGAGTENGKEEREVVIGA